MEDNTENKNRIMSDQPIRLAEIKAARKKKGIQFKALEEATGVSRQALSAYERGDYPPRPEIWEKLKSILGLEGNVEDFFGRNCWFGTIRGTKGSRIQKVVGNDKCFIKDCQEAPATAGFCAKHYGEQRRLSSKDLCASVPTPGNDSESEGL